MARKFKAIKGNSTVTVEGPYRTMFEDTLRLAYPDIVKTLEGTVRKIKDEAVKEWPVRRKNSKRSVDQFDIRFGLTNDGITVSLENNAPYAAGILAGKLKPSLNETGQVTTVRPAQLVWWQLLYKPAVNATDRLLNKLADELIKEMKGAK